MRAPQRGKPDLPDAPTPREGRNFVLDKDLLCLVPIEPLGDALIYDSNIFNKNILVVQINIHESFFYVFFKFLFYLIGRRFSSFNHVSRRVSKFCKKISVWFQRIYGHESLRS